MRYACTNLRRLLAVKQAGLLNGIEYVEVRDTDEANQDLRQRTLYVRLVLAVPPTLEAGDVVIDGGDRIATVAVDWAAAATDLPSILSAAEQAALLDGLDEPDHVLVVRTRERGDFSRYRIALRAGVGSSAAPDLFDPLLAEAAFSFKVECPSDFDCAPDCTCPPTRHTAPPIDYLAKDYQGFRRIMLERMSLLAPEWTERNPADVGVAVVELMAFIADELSYRQDAVATEAYLDTARSRVSLRRHARLVDYRVDEGCNARAWVQVQPEAGSTPIVLPAGTALLTRVPDLPAHFAPDSREDKVARSADPVVFETVDLAVLSADLSELRFWTWGEQGCCLAEGATSATLRGHHQDLRAGDVLILAETTSPTTGHALDADPAKRWAVRLVDVRSAQDPSGSLFPAGTTAITEIRWHADDALPFPLCLSVVEGDLETARAWGNIVRADHGQTQPVEGLGVVPAPQLVRVGPGGCENAGPDVVPVRFRPALQRRPLTRAGARPATVLFEVALTAGLSAELAARTFGPLLEAVFLGHDRHLAGTSSVRGTDPVWSISDRTHAHLLRAESGRLQVLAQADPAVADRAARPSQALPALRLVGTLDGVPDPWLARADLLGSDGSKREFTVESEDDAAVRLRFGDNEHGLSPPTGTAFTATYRVGNGVAGNVGREAISHARTTVTGIAAVRNPLPASGGVEPETAEQVRRDAPEAFAVQQRAVTEADYAEVTQRNRQVQRAAASFRWTGSWHTVFVTADRFGAQPVDDPFEQNLRDWLEPYRMAGYDLEVDGPTFVPLKIGMLVCLVPGHFRSDVAEQVHAVLSDRTRADGRRGLFHPDNLTFGQPVYLSNVYAAVHSVPGVRSVDVTTFCRQRQPETSGLDSGVLQIGRLEIARLDDDPNFPERGVLDLTFGGGT